MRQWQLDHPGDHTNAAEQGKMSGAEWKALTDEQKQPYIEMAQREKQRVREQFASRRPSGSTAGSEKKQSGAKGAAMTSAAEQVREEEKEASDVGAKDERKEAMQSVEAVEEEFSELSPALSSRRPSDPSVQPVNVSVAAEPITGRKGEAIHNAPFEAPRPASAMLMYVNDTVQRTVEEARSKGVRLLKGDARKAARKGWDELTDTERSVSHTAALHSQQHPLPLQIVSSECAVVCCTVCSLQAWRELREQALREWQRSPRSVIPPTNQAVAAEARSVIVQAMTDHPVSNDNSGGSERKERADEVGEEV